MSLVEFPAVEYNFIKQNKNVIKTITFSTDEEQMTVTGPALVVDKEIYRYDEQLGEYYLVYNKETIKQKSKDFYKQAKEVILS